MRPPMQLGPQVIQAGASIGIGIHHPVVSTARLLALADEALYEAKARGRSGWALRSG
jgi:PleD family two-component response regulator